MAILALTIFLSLILAAGFAACFVHAATRKRGAGAEQQSLMPLEDDDHRHDS